MKTERWWISSHKFNWFKGLFVNSCKSKEDANWEELIYFDSQEDANDFLDKFKEFIIDNYPRAKKDGWF